MNHYKLPMLSITALFFIAQILLILGLAEKGHIDYVQSVLVTTGFWAIYLYLEARYKLNMSNYVRIIMLLALVSDGFFGNYVNFYATSTVFDKIQHVFGTYAFSLFAYTLVAGLLKSPVQRSVTFILIISLGVSIGAFYEILEFFTDSMSHPVPPSQPSLLDTNLDLISDVIGALLAAIHVTYRKGKKM
ncbi:MAG: hypothetical protein H7X79_10015 [Sporomusaceae bacterium]|nr:hypothetical protein [Sporomusaceae bacterium]